MFCTQVNAALVSFDYTGTIVHTPGQIIVPEGTTFSGSFSYQDGISGLPRLGASLYSPVNFALSIDSVDISFSGSMFVDDNSTQIFKGFDVLQIGLFGISPMPTINNTLIEGISINLTDSTQTNLTSDR